MAKRRSLSPRERLAIFERNGGICHLCSRQIVAGETWDISHDRPLELLGEDSGANLKVAHRACHRAHTAQEDLPRIAKAKAQKRAALGIKNENRQKLQSRGFAKPEKSPRIDKGALGPLGPSNIYRRFLNG